MEVINIFDTLGSSDEFWEANRRALSDNERYHHHPPQAPGIRGQVDRTAERVAISVHNSRHRKEDNIFSSELFIICSIMLTKVVLWMLYRSAEEQGLEVTDL